MRDYGDLLSRCKMKNVFTEIVRSVLWLKGIYVRKFAACI